MNGGVGADFVGCALGQDAPEIEHRYAIGELHDHIHVVLDQQDRGVLRDLQNDLVEGVDLGVGEALRWFNPTSEPAVAIWVIAPPVY